MKTTPQFHLVPRILKFKSLGSISLAAGVVACQGLDASPFAPDPAASAGMAGWVVNGEGGEASISTGGVSGWAGRAGAAGVLPRGGSSGESESTGGSAGTSPAAGGASASGGAAGRATGGSGSSADSKAGSAGAAANQGSAGEAGGAAEEPPKQHALHISEYVEGSANFKAIEIIATEASTLEGCRLLFFFNGGIEPSSIALEGTLEAGEALSLCTSELIEEVGSLCMRQASLRFNGNDAIQLECSGEVRDTFGQVGNDPKSGWGSGEVSTLNRTLRRRCDPLSLPANHPFDPAEQWDAFPTDTFDDIGVHTCRTPDDQGAAGSPGNSGDAGQPGDDGQAGAGGDARGSGQGGVQAT